MMRQYLLDERGEPRRAADPDEWAEWYEAALRKPKDTLLRVAVTYLAKKAVKVSTVFLALDHQFGEGIPLLWETMVFATCPRLDALIGTGLMERCGGSREQAMAMHLQMVKRIRNLLRNEKSKEAAHRRR